MDMSPWLKFPGAPGSNDPVHRIKHLARDRIRVREILADDGDAPARRGQHSADQTLVLDPQRLAEVTMRQHEHRDCALRHAHDEMRHDVAVVDAARRESHVADAGTQARALRRQHARECGR